MERLGIKALCLGVLGGLLGLGLSGCISPPAIVKPTLIFTDLVGPVGEQGELKVKVGSMPDGGLAALVVGAWDGTQFLGLRYDPSQFEVIGVEGLNGFEILAVYIDNGNGEVRFVAVNPHKGLIEGDIARIVGSRLGDGDFAFQVAMGNLELLDAGGNLVTTHELVTGTAPPYYIEEGE